MRVINVLFLGCLLPQFLSADFAFEGPFPLHESMANSMTCIVAADIDGDGDQDIVYSSESSFQIMWAENEYGLGGFGAKHLIDDNVHPTNSIVAADLDGDGDLDLLTASRGGKNVLWYENQNGTGRFSEPHIIAENCDAINATVADFDGDGDVDVLAAYHFHHYDIVWFKNSGTEGFVEQPSIGTGYDITDQAYALDFDHDGDVDIVATFESEPMVWYENVDGNGHFSTATALLTNVWRTVAMGDVNGDGFFDVLFPYEKDLFLALGKADLTFESPELIHDFVYDGWPLFDLHLVDIDNDSDLDIITALGHTNTVVWFENIDGTGTFGKERKILDYERVEFIYPADFDNDGLIDFAAAGWSKGLVWCKMLNTDVSFSQPKEITFITEGIFQVCCGDIDGDDDTDLVANANQSLLLFVNSDGYEVFEKPIIIGTVHSPLYHLYLLDVDADSDLDILTDFGIFINAGNAQFTHDEFSLQTPRQPLIFDVDGDNDVDILVPENNRCFINQDGRGNFVARDNIFPFSARFWRGCSAVDIDLDGDKDVFGQIPLDGLSDHRYIWSENRDGEFTDMILFSVPEDQFVRQPRLADIDADGDLDIYGVHENRNILWFEFQADLIDFARPQRINCPDDVQVNRIYSDIDFDQDGDDDIIFSGNTLNELLSIYENTGYNGAFVLKTLIHNSIYDAVKNLHFVDMNSNGKIDILSYNSSPPRLIWYKNMDTTGVTRRAGRPKPTLTHHVLHQNFPNPFNPKTIMTYELASDGWVTLELYNLKGQLVTTLVDDYQTTGFHAAEWQPRNYAAGLYFYKLTVNDFSQTKKLLYQK